MTWYMKLFQFALGLVLVVTAWVKVSAPDQDLVIRRFREAGVPLTLLLPREEVTRAEPPATAPDGEGRSAEGPADLPGVLVAHGFAGSKQLMLGYGYTLARAGYAVLLWDFAGHGANRRPFEEDALQSDLEVAARTLAGQTEVDGERLALVGHSLGGGAVMAAGIRDRDRYLATVAVSPTDAEVTPDAPPNLQLQAGEWEPRFLDAARRLLRDAGGEQRGPALFAAGLARHLVVVPFAEHVSILFRDESHVAARSWIDAANAVSAADPRGPGVSGAGGGAPAASPVRRQAGSEDGTGGSYRDRRILWYGIQVVGFFLLLASVAPMVKARQAEEQAWVRWPMHGLGVVLAPLVASVVVCGLGRIVDVAALGGMAIGGTLVLWWFVAGGLWLLAAVRPRRPSASDLLWGLILFGFLWCAVGALAHQVWMNWSLVPERLLRWPVFALGCLPWFLAAESIQGSPEGRGRWVWWASQSAGVVAGILLLVSLVPSLSLLTILLPVFPVLLAGLGFAGSRFNRVWSYGIGCSLFLGWMIAAVFPLVA